MDPISIARYGMRTADMSFSQSAQRVASNDDGLDLAAETVNMLQAKTQFSANLNVIKIADEMWRSLLDIQAGR